MEDFQQRVIDEATELRDKVEKLLAFTLTSPIFKSLPLEEQSRLMRQQTYMSLYLIVLTERINEFT